MKLNWGWGIGIFYVCFMIIMVGMVVYSTKNKVQMVQDQYYDKDLNYEAFRQKRQNATALDQQLQIKYIASQEQLELTFPDEMNVGEGTLTFFRPSSSMQDQKISLKTDQYNQMRVPTKALSKGQWKVLLDFESEGKSYYKEEYIIL